MIPNSICRGAFLPLLLGTIALPSQAQNPVVTLEAENPALQQGSHKRDTKNGASGGEVLGEDFGSVFGDFAQYDFNLAAPVSPAKLTLRYAREAAGNALLAVTLDGANVGTIACGPSGGWGDRPEQIVSVAIQLPPLKAGAHVLRLTVVAGNAAIKMEEKKLQLKAVPVLDSVGNRSDKNTVGHGKNVALYTGASSRFFYATHELGDIFSAVDGSTLNWYPDHVVVTPQIARGNINLDRIEISASVDTAPIALKADELAEMRQVCVTQDDVVVSKLHFKNNTAAPITRRIEIKGDCRGSFDWRGRKGGEKQTHREGNNVVLVDRNVFPEVLSEGLAMVIGGNLAPVEADVSIPGAYRLVYEVTLPSGGQRDLVLGCAIERTADTAKANLAKVLAQPNPLAVNRADWQRFYEKEIPQFECSDPKLNELYNFRWFLLKFSTAGGDLGLFKYPVVMEGREEFQTYCCYSAPFMAFDLNWATNPQYGFGHIANMATVAYSARLSRSATV
ncbi:hypothetical protein EON80_10905, partial [bacterium]